MKKLLVLQTKNEMNENENKRAVDYIEKLKRILIKQAEVDKILKQLQTSTG